MRKIFLLTKNPIVGNYYTMSYAAGLLRVNYFKSAVVLYFFYYKENFLKRNFLKLKLITLPITKDILRLVSGLLYYKYRTVLGVISFIIG